jgi:hypothetical protein
MRKRCKRAARPIARPLTLKERVDFMIGPRLHLQMLLSQHFALPYICSLVGVFNISEVLACQLERPDLLANFAAAQELILELVEQNRAPTVGEGALLRNAFNISDALIVRQNTLTIARAMQQANHALADGEEIVRARTPRSVQDNSARS